MYLLAKYITVFIDSRSLQYVNTWAFRGGELLLSLWFLKSFLKTVLYLVPTK